jgi:hypothetical protein
VKKAPKPDATPSAQPDSRLSGIRRVPHDDDERPSREDADYGHTIFTRGPVSLPRWLTGRKQAKRD